MLVFDPERGKPEYMYQGKTSWSKGENLIWLRCRDLNSGHIGERWVLSPLRHPSIPFLSIYIYIKYMYIFMYMILLLSISSSSSSSLHLRKSFPTTSSSESSNRFVSLLYTTRQHLNRIGPRVFSLVAIFGGISIVLHVSFTPGGFTSASSSIFKTNVQMSR